MVSNVSRVIYIYIPLVPYWTSSRDRGSLREGRLERGAGKVYKDGKEVERLRGGGRESSREYREERNNGRERRREMEEPRARREREKRERVGKGRK